MGRPICIVIQLAMLWFLVPGALSADARTPFLFAYEAQEVFPYFMGATQKVRTKNPGMTIEMVKLLEQHLPLKISFVRLSWKRALIGLKAGRVDGIVASYKGNRLDFGAYPMKNGRPDTGKSLDQASYYLYVMKHAPIAWDPEKGRFTGVQKAIGAPAGYSVISVLQKAGVKVDAYGNTRENLVKLTAGRLDGAALLELNAFRILSMEKPLFSEVRKLEPPLISKHYYLVLSHQFRQNHPHLADRIWQTCTKIRKTDRQRLLERYIHLPGPS